jgi:hypothetical protein
MRVNEFYGVVVASVDVLGHVPGHGVVREYDNAFIVFLHSGGSVLAMVNILEQVAEVCCALGCTSEGDIFGLYG